MDYRSLLAAAKADPATTDFYALRQAYQDSPDYDPYARNASAEEKLHRASEKGDTKAALKACQKLLETCYLDARTHFTLVGIHKELGNATERMYHLAFGKGLIDAVLAGGDGASPATAWPVIDVREEYAVIAALGLKAKEQGLIQHEGRSIDRIQVHDPRKHMDLTVHFDVTRPMQHLQQQLPEDGDKA